MMYTVLCFTASYGYYFVSFFKIKDEKIPFDTVQ